MPAAAGARLLLALALLAAAALGACGGGEGVERIAPASAVPWMDPEGEEPLVGALDIDPADGALWMATNAGLFRLPEGARRPERVTGTLTTPDGSGAVSEQLVVRFTGPGRLLASGHPSGEDSALPEALGLIASQDAARTWKPVSGLGELDFHTIDPVGGTLVASEFEGARVLVSGDGGRTWESRVAPRVLAALAVDPDDGDRWVGSAEDGLYLTEDQGRSWRPVDSTPYSRLTWRETGALYRLDPEGQVKLSTDGGRTWEERGAMEGEPEALVAAGGQTLYAALADGTVRRSDDGGRAWTDVLSPPG